MKHFDDAHTDLLRDQWSYIESGGCLKLPSSSDPMTGCEVCEKLQVEIMNELQRRARKELTDFPPEEEWPIPDENSVAVKDDENYKNYFI